MTCLMKEYASLLRSCIHCNSLIGGQIVHTCIIKSGLGEDISNLNALIHMYSNCGDSSDAARVLGFMTNPNVVSWTSMISSSVSRKLFDTAMDYFYHMIRSTVRPNHFTLASILPACQNLRHGKQMHNYIIRNRLRCDVVVGTALIDMYAKFGQVNLAEKMFDKMPERNLVTWNVMISAYCDHGDMLTAKKLFEKLTHKDMVSWNSIVAGYFMSGKVDQGFRIFGMMPQRDVVSWNSAIVGCVENGMRETAIDVFKEMLLQDKVQDKVEMNADTFAVILPVFGDLADAGTARSVHCMLIAKGFHGDAFVGSSLIDMYAKCGSIEDARRVFEGLPEHRQDVVIWTAMMTGYAFHGYAKEAIALFVQMENEGVRPDHVTFVALLHGCCHAGLVDDGLRLFQKMTKIYRLVPGIQHYCSMVDLFGRSGLLDQALDFINSMPIKADASLWRNFLGACKSHKNVELGQYAAKQLLELDSCNSIQSN